MNATHRPLPYFNALLGLLDQYPEVAESFGRHVHWGYWDKPSACPDSSAGFAAAAERLAGLVCAAASIGRGQRVLDVGCGFGGTIASLDGHWADLALHGLNIEHRQLRRAAQQTLPAPVNPVYWINADACALPFASQSFDAVLAVECIFHFPSRREFFSEAFRVLNPGGYLALSDFLSTPWLRPATWLLDHWPGHLGFYGCCDVRFGFAEYRKLAVDTGFILRTERDITPNTLPTYRYIHALWRRVPFRNPQAALETLLLESVSRCGLLRYGILGFQKPT